MRLKCPAIKLLLILLRMYMHAQGQFVVIIIVVISLYDFCLDGIPCSSRSLQWTT